MARAALFLFLLLAGCSPKSEDNRQPQARRTYFPDFHFSRQARLASIEGLFEGGSGAGADQLCIIDRRGHPQFGLVIRGSGNRSCSGAGSARRRGEKVQLTMTGDSPCTLDGRISGKTITLEDQPPSGCTYYCGGGASFAGVALSQSSAGEKAAMKAKDLVGEPLCGGLAS